MLCIAAWCFKASIASAQTTAEASMWNIIGDDAVPAVVPCSMNAPVMVDTGEETDPLEVSQRGCLLYCDSLSLTGSEVCSSSHPLVANVEVCGLVVYLR